MFSLYLVLFLGFWFFSCRQFWWVTLKKKKKKKKKEQNNIFKITRQRQTGSSKIKSKVYLKFSLIHLFRYWLHSKAASKLYFLWKLWICKIWKINGWCVRLLVKVLLSWPGHYNYYFLGKTLHSHSTSFTQKKKWLNF